MSVYLITGGGGFIGSNLAEALLRRGDDVRVLDNFVTGRRENLTQAEDWAVAGGGRFTLVDGDIRDVEARRSAMDGVDFVLHKAAIPSVPYSLQEPVLTHDVNVNGTLGLLESAREAQVRRFVYASSSSIYGESEVLPKVEQMPPVPISPYGLQKLTAESYCLLYHRLWGLPTMALRYFNVFGPRQNPNSEYAAVIPRFITALRANRSPTIYGDGEQTRDFTYIDNVVRGNILACEVDPQACGRAYNLACGERTSLNDLAGTLSGLLGAAIEPEHVEERPGDIRHSLAGIERARSLLGYAPTVGLREGLERTVEAI